MAVFGKSNKDNNQKSSKSSSAPVSSGLNSIVSGTTLEGVVHANSDIRIDGTIKGALHCTAKVIIGPSGVVEGEITCQNAIIEGRFQGNIQVKELLNVREKAVIVGDVKTATLIVQSGGVIDGTCDMGSSKTSTNVKKEKLATVG